MVVSAVMRKLTWVHERTSLSFVYTFVSSRKHHLIFLSPAYLLYNHSLGYSTPILLIPLPFPFDLCIKSALLKFEKVCNQKYY